MIDISRRSFLRGIIAVSATAVITPKLQSLKLLDTCPILYSDGIHDDAPALNALLRREEVRIENDLVKVANGEWCSISGGNFLINDTITIANKFFHIKNSSFKTGPLFAREKPMIYVTESGAFGNLNNLYLENIT